MRLCYLTLLEAAENVDKYLKQATAVAAELGVDADELLKNAFEADPHPKKKNVTWILKQVKLKNIILPEDAERLITDLKEYERLKRKNKLEKKDLNQYETVNELEDAIEAAVGVKATEAKGLPFDPSSYPGVTVYGESGPYVVLRITSKPSCAELGEGTQWCTRKSYSNGGVDYHTRHGALYQIWKNGEQYCQYTSNYDQVKDVKDREFIPDHEAALLMKPDPDILSGRIPTHDKQHDKKHDELTLRLGYLRVTGLRDRELEQSVVAENDPEKALRYIETVKQAIPALTDIVMSATGPRKSLYGYGSGGGNWGFELVKALQGSGRPLPEKLKSQLLQDLNADTFLMVIKAQKSRWPEGEEVLHVWSNAPFAIKYCQALGAGVPELVPTVLRTSGTSSIMSAIEMLTDIRERTPKIFFKELLARECSDADILKVVKLKGNRWPDAEPQITTPDGAIAYFRATKYKLPNADQLIISRGLPRQALAWMILTGRTDWPEAEEIVAKDTQATAKFVRITGRPPLQGKQEADTPEACYRHACVLGDEYPEGEPIILKDLDIAIEYAAKIIGPWPELEAELKAHGTDKQRKQYQTRVLGGLSPAIGMGKMGGA